MEKSLINLSCVVAMLSSFSGCGAMQAIDKGLYSATDSVTQRDRLTGQRTLSLQDRAHQIQLGNEFTEKFIAEAKAKGKRLNGDYDPIAYERIKRIFSRLHDVSHARDEQWTPVLVEDKDWNAFTTGGTYFVINSGLEKDLKDDSELANVIAHEMAHTVANHGFEQLSYRQLSTLTGSNSAERNTFQAAFTHENEAEADRVAVLYCTLAGYDPHAGAHIWQRMLKKTGNDALFVHTHPMNSERAAQAEKVANQVSKYYTPDKLNPDFKAILASNEIFSNHASPETEAGKGGGILAALDAALTTVAQQQQAKHEEQRQQRRIKFMQSVQKLSPVVSSAPIGPNAWRITVRYGGNRALTDLSFKLKVNRFGDEALMITQQLAGALYPNTTFYIDFQSPELKANKTSPKDVSYFYDNARAL